MSTKVFGIFASTDLAEAAVDELVDSGFAGSEILVLHPENQTTREFANRKGTRAPDSTVYGKTASIPLDGKLGIFDPGTGPIGGALPDALAEMGVPADWCNRRVLHGKVLLSVNCKNPDAATSASRILAQKGADDVESNNVADFESSATEELSGSQEPGERWASVSTRNSNL